MKRKKDGLFDSGRFGYEKKKQRTRYKAPADACANCPPAELCKGGKGPRKVSRSDFAEQFAHAKEQTATDQYELSAFFRRGNQRTYRRVNQSTDLLDRCKLFLGNFGLPEILSVFLAAGALYRVKSPFALAPIADS